MARTDVKKAHEAAWVPCPIEAYEDERHLLLPSTLATSQYVSDKSMVNEFRDGRVVRESDPGVFTTQWLKKHWLGWQNVGIVHEDGRVEDPAECTIENRMILAHERGIAFVLWLQEASRALGMATASQIQTERDNFREAGHVPTRSSEPEL